MTRVRLLYVGGGGAVSWLFFACCGGFFVGCVLAFAGVCGLASAVSWAKDGIETVAVQAFALAAPADVQYVLGLLPEGLLDQRPMNPGMLLSPFGVHRSAAVGIAQGLVRIAAGAGQDGVAAKIGGLRGVRCVVGSRNRRRDYGIVVCRRRSRGRRRRSRFTRIPVCNDRKGPRLAMVAL